MWVGKQTKIIDYIHDAANGIEAAIIDEDRLKKYIHDVKIHVIYNYFKKTYPINKIITEISRLIRESQLTLEKAYEIYYRYKRSKEYQDVDFANIESILTHLNTIEDSTKAELKKKEAELKKKEAELQTSKAQIPAIREVEEPKAELKATRAKLQATKAELQTIKAQLQTTNAELETTQAALEALEATKAAPEVETKPPEGGRKRKSRKRQIKRSGRKSRKH
jgi:chromosome segregation ATPase